MKPDKASIKPINLYDVEVFPANSEGIHSSMENRYLVIYPHMSIQTTEKLIKYLQEQLETEKGSVIYGIFGRMVG